MRINLANPFNAPVYHEECLSSTMDAIRSLARNGEPHGTVILADFQESGRGRQGRPWKAEKGQSLMFSIFLNYHDFPAALALKSGLAVSLAIGDFIPAMAPFVQVKWPNDVLIILKGEARKTAGILTETEGTKVFVGIGVNLVQRTFPEELRFKAGSLFSMHDELFPGHEIPQQFLSANAPLNLLEKVLIHLYRELEAPVAQLPWKARLEERLYKRGKRVIFVEGVADSTNIIQGCLTGIGEGGELLLIVEGEKKPQAFITGELRVY